MAEDVVRSPVIESWGIVMSGKMKGLQKIVLPGGVKKLKYNWINHMATVVKVNGELKVIDLALSNEVIDLDKWVSMYNPGRTCPQITSSESIEINVNDTCERSLKQNCPKPKNLCGYFFYSRPDFKMDAGIRDLRGKVSFRPKKIN